MWLTFQSRIETISCRLMHVRLIPSGLMYINVYVLHIGSILWKVTLNDREQERNPLTNPNSDINMTRNTMLWFTKHQPPFNAASTIYWTVFLRLNFIILWYDLCIKYEASWLLFVLFGKFPTEKKKCRNTHNRLRYVMRTMKCTCCYFFYFCMSVCVSVHVFLFKIDLLTPFHSHSLSSFMFTPVFPSISIEFDLFAIYLHWHVSFFSVTAIKKESMTLAFLQQHLYTKHGEANTLSVWASRSRISTYNLPSK